MKEGPDLAYIASLIGDPARANMLAALMGGGALTATELALEAGVAAPTASSHLARLTQGRLINAASQGRHRYYRLASPQVAGMLEVIMGVAGALGPRRVRPGPRDSAMRAARVCYDHLAGQYAVEMFDRFVARGILAVEGEAVSIGVNGAQFFADSGVALDLGRPQRRPMCRVCLDWSMRRTHLAGALGAAILDHLLAQKWARREASSRVIRFTSMGRCNFEAAFLR